MALGVVGSTGRPGQIVLKDEREDGTIILLICDKLVPAFVLRPDQQDTPSDRDGFPWVDRHLRPAFGIELESEPFELTVHTTQMPAGPAAFSTNEFIDRAVDVADDGVDVVHLNPMNAVEWGYKG